MGREKIIGGIVTFILGLIFLVIGRYFIIKYKRLKTKGINTSGKILEKKIRSNKRLYITVKYTAEKEVIVKRIITSRFLLQTLNEGDEINIFYDPKKPASFCFEGDQRYIMRAVIFFCAGGLELMIALLSFLR